MDSGDSEENSSDFSCNCRDCSYPRRRNRHSNSGVNTRSRVSVPCESYGRAFCLTVAGRRSVSSGRPNSSLCLYDVQKSVDTTASERSISPLMHRPTRSQSCSSSLDEYSSDSTYGHDFVSREKSLLDMQPKFYAQQRETEVTVDDIKINHYQETRSERHSSEPVKFINVWFGNLIEPNLRDFTHQPTDHTEDFVDSGLDKKIKAQRILETECPVSSPKVSRSASW